jgi:membrane-bound metal-dependent hydrolase YbcI (DUF457 family)
MAGFQTHITTGAAVGVAYAWAGHLLYQMPLPTCVLSAGLCTVGSVLPDVDSDNGVILRESLAFVAAVTPMLMLHRFRELGWTNESIVLASAGIYLLIRFVLGEFLKRYTVHRGMWHSLPAAALAGLVVYYLCSCPDQAIRVYKSLGFAIGYTWHLLLDEIYSLLPDGRGLRVKRSFGTALKLWSGNTWANVSTYGKLLAMIALIAHD